MHLPKKKSSMSLMIVELKWNRTEDSAIEQISECNYPQMFEGYGGDILFAKITYDEKDK